MGDGMRRVLLTIAVCFAAGANSACAQSSADVCQRQTAYPAIAHLTLKQFDRARDDIDQALALAPASSEALAARGNLLLQVGDYQAALTAYNGAIEHGAADAQIYIQRAAANHLVGRRQQAIADFDHALSLQAAHSLSAMADQLREAMAMNDPSPESRQTLSLLYAFSYARVAEIELWNDLTEDAPEDSGVLHNSSFAHARWGEALERAAALCERAVRVYGDDGAFAIYLALIRTKPGRFQDAWDVISHVEALDENPHYLYSRGLVALRLNRQEEGWAAINRAIAGNPNIALTFASYGLTP